MTEHAAGWWQVDKEPEWAEESGGYWAVYIDESKLIAKVYHGEANARLIAAAPIGYELAEAVLAWAREPRNHGGNPYLMEHVKLAETFMAKARGQEVSAS